MTAMTAAHWFDRPKFLLEADRVLRPGGCLALLSYTMDMELEYGDISSMLNVICKEVHRGAESLKSMSHNVHMFMLFSGDKTV